MNEQQKRLRIKQKRRRTLLTAIICTALIFIAFLLLHRLGTEIRGYNAIGGEASIFLLPFIIILAVDSWHKIIDSFKR